MRTFQEIKDTVVGYYGYESFDQFDDENLSIPCLDMPKIVDEIAKQYATECCKASLEKAAEKAKISYHACGEGQNCGCGGNCDHPIRSVDKRSVTDPKNIVIL